MIGQILNNRYEIVEKIGEGGMAKVYKAKCNVLNRFVAIKVLKEQYMNDEVFVEKFKGESQAAASLSHPNIVNVYDVGYVETPNGKIPYIVMEYIKGKTLKEVIIENKKLNISDTIFYSLQIAEAIGHAHLNRIIHRDIKPHNIMIDDNNRVKVTDFGIAKAVTSSTMTIGSDTLGSVHYISPEQARGGYTDEKSDIYSLGIVMYEMITGKLPFDAETPVAVALKHIQEDIMPPREMDSSISEELESIILKAVSKNQSDRYQNMSDIIVDLKNINTSKIPIINQNKTIEDSATMVIPIIKDEDIVKKDEFVEDLDDEFEEEDEKSGIKTTVLAILLGLLIVGIIFLGFLKFKDIFKSSEVIVPDFVGMQIEEAEKKAIESDLKLTIKDKVESNEFEEGEIIEQNKEANSKVKAESVVEVTVSQGSELIRVPIFLNQTLDQAINTMKELGLEIGETKYRFSDTFASGTVMEQSPKSNTFLAKGDKILLVISNGKEIKTVIMPDLIGSSIEQAKNKLSSVGLNIGNIKEEYNSEFSKGIVYFQSYGKGIKLEKNTSIEIYVSKGVKVETETKPEPEPEPEIKPEPEPETETKPEPEPEPEIKPEPEPEPEIKPDPKPESEQKPKPETDSKPEAKNSSLRYIEFLSFKI